MKEKRTLTVSFLGQPSSEYEEVLRQAEEAGIKIRLLSAPAGLTPRIPYPIVSFCGVETGSRECGYDPGLALIEDVLKGKVR